MPWTPSDSSSKTHKANSPEKERVWASVANKALAKSGDDGSAIRIANAVISHMPEYGKKKKGS